MPKEISNRNGLISKREIRNLEAQLKLVPECRKQQVAREYKNCPVY